MATWSQTTDHNSNYTLQLIVNEDSYSIANNTSEVSYTLNFITTSAGYSGTINSINLSINGESIISESGVVHNFSTHNTTYQLAKGTMTIAHDADGSKTIGVYAEIDTPTGASYSPGYADISKSLALTTIPRAPSYNSISASNITETSVKLTASIDTKTLSITDGGWDVGTSTSSYNYYSGDVTSKIISGLSANTTYYYRGHATTAGGSSTSEWGTFKTYAYPAFTTNPSVGSIAETTAVLNRGVANIDCTFQYSWDNSTWKDLTSQTLSLTGLTPGSSNTIYVRLTSVATGSTTTKSVTFKCLDYVMKINVSGSWKNAVPYIKVNGSWKKAIPYINVDGTWKEGKQ